MPTSRDVEGYAKLGVDASTPMAAWPDPATQRRIDELAAKCNEGELTEEERQEYASYIQAANLAAIQDAKAHLDLKRAAT